MTVVPTTHVTVASSPKVAPACIISDDSPTPHSSAIGTAYEVNTNHTPGAVATPLIPSLVQVAPEPSPSSSSSSQQERSNEEMAEENASLMHTAYLVVWGPLILFNLFLL